MSYKYVKAPPGYTLHKKTSFKTKVRLTFSAVLLTTGVAAFTSVAYPMLVYQLTFDKQFNKSPESASFVVEASEPRFLPEMINTTFDYTNSSTWFPKEVVPSSPQPDILYTLSIAKLGIENAIVRSDHTDLKKTLIHYPGTAAPGDLGNTVIFGHSVLPQFFNPKNYTSIFSTLHTLVIGDEIKINAEGATYIYKIVDIYSVDPDNLSPLAQSFDKHRLTVITCTPPGTYLKRLILRAELL